MHVEKYLQRVGFKGRAQADLDSLQRIHRGHALNIPYENLDIQFGRAVSRDVACIFDKIVNGRRGGWCYEMNGLLAWALEDLGFRITRLAGGVRRSEVGDQALGNHLVLLVHLERDYLADVGFGDGLIEPVPLEVGTFRQGGSEFQLESLAEGWWRFHGDARGGGLSFDFDVTPACERLLESKCQWLQTSAESVFVQNAIVQRHLDGSHAALRGCVLRLVGKLQEVRELKSADEYVETLREVFGLDLPEASGIWPRIEARHKQVFPNGFSAALKS